MYALLNAYFKGRPGHWYATADANAMRDTIRERWVHFLADATPDELFRSKAYLRDQHGMDMPHTHDLKYDLVRFELLHELGEQLGQALRAAFVREARVRPVDEDRLLAMLYDTPLGHTDFLAEADAWLTPRVLSMLVRRRHGDVMMNHRTENPIALLRYMYAHGQLNLEYVGPSSLTLEETLRDAEPEVTTFLKQVKAEERRLAVAMATHSRLGAESGLGRLELQDTLSPYLLD